MFETPLKQSLAFFRRNIQNSKQCSSSENSYLKRVIRSSQTLTTHTETYKSGKMDLHVNSSFFLLNLLCHYGRRIPEVLLEFKGYKCMKRQRTAK